MFSIKKKKKKCKIGSSALISAEKTKINIIFSGYSEYLNEQASLFCGCITYNNLVFHFGFILDEIRRKTVTFKVEKSTEPDICTGVAGPGFGHLWEGTPTLQKGKSVRSPHLGRKKQQKQYVMN